MKTVLHLIDQAGPGGAQTVFVDLATQLDRARWQSIAAVPDEGSVADDLRSGGVEPVFTPIKRGPVDIRYLRQLLGLIKTRRVDLVHAHLLGPGVYGSLAGIARGVPVVTTFHGQTDVSPAERLRGIKFGLINRGAGSVVFVSERLRQFFLSVTRLDPARTTVIHNGVDFSIFQPGADRSLREEIGVRGDEILVGAIGHLRPPKAYDVFLRAAARLHGESKAFKFVIVGAPEGTLLPELTALRNELGLRDVVSFAGFRRDINRVINSLDVYVITSSSEGFSLSAVQAMACGVPVVSTRCGGPEEIITDGQTGLLVDVGRPDAIASAVGTLTATPELGVRLATAARASVEERFSREKMLLAYSRLYDRCLGVAD